MPLTECLSDPGVESGEVKANRGVRWAAESRATTLHRSQGLEATLRGVASNSTSATSGSNWSGVCPSWAAFGLVLVIVLMIVIAGCGGGQVPADGTPQQPTPAADGGQGSSVVFPVHDELLGTDRGEEYLAGQLVLEEGCLRLVVPSGMPPTLGHPTS